MVIEQASDAPSGVDTTVVYEHVAPLRHGSDVVATSEDCRGD